MDGFLRARAEQLAGEIASQAKTVEDLNGLMRLMMKSTLERMLNTEMDVHLGRKGFRPEASCAAETPESSPPTKTKRPPNRRNGRSKKTVQGESGQARRSNTPRDRNGTFEPQLIGKHQRRLAGFDDKILALYAKGMTTRDIQEIVEDALRRRCLADARFRRSPTTWTQEVTAWRTRPLDAVWPIVYFDGIVVHVRGANGRVSQHTIYVALGVNLEGKKELLGPVAGARTKGPSSGFRV